MELKRNIAITVGWLVFSCNSAVAGQMYSIDPTQSYIKTYVPSWISNPNFGLFHLSPNGGFWTPGWALQWDLTAFSLSGSFDGTVEWSPWIQGVGHLAISQQDYKVGAPITGPFNLPSILTFYQSSGEIVHNTGPCATDPFWPWPGPGWSCTGWSSGIPPYLSGVFDGKTLDIQGNSGGFYQSPNNIVGYTGESPPPVDPALLPQQYYSYRIIATTVPEPSSLPLFFLGIVALYQIKRRKLSS